MKFNSLQFGKAMSAALFVLLLSVAGMKNALAQTQVATLQHGEDISVFYGNNAFVEAHTAAVDGDIVTLSSGSFIVPFTITKAITLRGAGVVVDTVSGINPTIFPTHISIDVQNNSVALNIEGILFNGSMSFGKLNNPKFTKCSFYEIYRSTSSSSMNNAQFVDCIIRQMSFDFTYNTTFINSVVWSPSYIVNPYSVLLYNSILGPGSSISGGLSAFNSIIFSTTGGSPTSACSFFNCIGIKLGSQSPFGAGYTSGCTTYTSYTTVFESFTGSFSLEEPFILKEEIATGFLGNDGTQVGIYGGFVPYNSRPSYMVIERCNVANRSTIDGKLSVEIEVVTEGE